MVKVKVCGITDLEDALAALEYGADALGFVLAPSPRRVTAETVREMVSQLPPFIIKVGVFVDSDLEAVRQALAFTGLDLAQLHGDEDPAYCAALFPQVIKAFATNRLEDLSLLGRYLARAYLLDKEKGPPSPLAEERHWQIARQAARYGPVILAGGLTPQNVAQAIATARPYAVDVSSGVEARPGKKDHKKLRDFIVAAKEASRG